MLKKEVNIKTSIKKATYLGMLFLLIILPFLFINTNQSSDKLNYQQSSQNFENENESKSSDDDWYRDLICTDFSIQLFSDGGISVKGSVPRYPLYFTYKAVVFIGIQDLTSANTDNWTSPGVVFEQTLSGDDDRFVITDNVIRTLTASPDTTPYEMLSKGNVRIFAGFKDYYEEEPSHPLEDDWEDAIFESTHIGITSVSTSDVNVVHSVEFEPLSTESTPSTIAFKWRFTRGTYWERHSGMITFSLNNDDTSYSAPYGDDNEWNEFSLNYDDAYDNHKIKFEFYGYWPSTSNKIYAWSIHNFEIGPENPVISNLEAKNITFRSADIEFNVKHGNQNNSFKTQLTENGNQGSWETFTPEEGDNIISLTKLTEGGEYIFKIKIDFVETKMIEFSTLKNSFFSHLLPQNIKGDYAEVSLNFELGNTGLEEKFYYRLMKEDDNTFNNWIEFDPVEGENIIEFTNLSENTEYIFQAKNDQTENRIAETDFTTFKHSDIQNLTVENIMLNSAEVIFDFQSGDSMLEEKFSYKIEKDTQPHSNWIKFTPKEGENTILLNDLEKNTNYTFEIRIDETTFRHEIEFSTLKHTVVNNLDIQNITSNSAEINFNVELAEESIGDKIYYRRWTTNQFNDDWISFEAVNGENTIELNNLMEDSIYHFEIWIEGSGVVKEKEFKTSKNSVIGTLTAQEVGQTSAEIVFGVEIGDSITNEKFYYRTIAKGSEATDEWVEFTPVVGKNVIELTDLIEGTDYVFEIKIEGSDSFYSGVASMDFKTESDKSVNLIMYLSFSVLFMILIISFGKFINSKR